MTVRRRPHEPRCVRTGQDQFARVFSALGYDTRLSLVKALGRAGDRFHQADACSVSRGSFATG